MLNSGPEEKNLAEKEGETSKFVDIELSPPVTEQLDKNSDDKEIPPEPLQSPTRGREKPKILGTRKRGRPIHARSMYTHIAEDARYIEDEIALFSEIPIKQAVCAR